MTVTKKIASAVGVLALSIGAMSASARADEGFSYAITIAGTSDYIFRGLSFNEEDPAFQPYVELDYNQFYLAFWGSNIDSDPIGPWEVDIYGGWRPTTGPISWDLGVLYYMYGSQDPTVNWDELDYVEFKIAASVTPVTNLTLGITGYTTPDQEGSPETWTIEGSAGYEFSKVGIFTPTISGLIGFSSASDAPGFFLGVDEYVYWNAGLKLGVENFFMDFRYWDTDIGDNVGNDFNNDFADSRFVFTAGVNLP